MRVGVLIDHILATHINVPRIRPTTYASGKEARVFVCYI
jgi:hypothetical protein